MTTQLAGQPIYVLTEGTERHTGRDARKMNILAAKVIAEAVKSTMGPRGMDKMLVDGMGNVVITNDGAAILKEVDVKHPAAKMMVDVAKVVEKEAGDGTTSAVVFGGELLKQAEDLMDEGVHANTVAKGFQLASDKAVKVLEALAQDVKPDNIAILRKVALTSLNSKAPGITAKDAIAKLAVDAVKTVAEEKEGGFIVDKGDIKLVKQPGDSTANSQIIKGIVLDKEKAHSGMPTSVKKAKIVLLDTEMKVKKTGTDAKVKISSPDQMQQFLDEEEHALKQMADDVAASGANVLICQKGIDDMIQYFLSKNGIFAIKSASGKDLKLLAKATGANIVTDSSNIGKGDLGYATLVEERKVGDKEYTFVEGCKTPTAVTVFIRGGTEHIVDEVERSMDDAISVIRDVLEDGKIICGGGASIMEMAKALRTYADKVSGREQLAIRAYADALETLPRTLAENAGLDGVDVLIDLRAAHEKGRKSAGLNIKTGRAGDMMKLGVVEPLRVREQTIKTATETAVMILRIDDVIAASGSLSGEGGGGMPPDMGGMGGMPGMM